MMIAHLAVMFNSSEKRGEALLAIGPNRGRDDQVEAAAECLRSDKGE
jgi:hypothetical protein